MSFSGRGPIDPFTQDEALVAWLGRPESYPHPVSQVERIETHISRVFLAGDYVYKLKKPVRYDFVDFSTLSRREAACREELRLNRRLAPHTYLDVVGVHRRPDGSFTWQPEGPLVEPLVRMRRLPTDQTLLALHRRGQLAPHQVDTLAACLAQFYQRQPPLPLGGPQYVARCRQHVADNRRVLLDQAPHIPLQVVQRVHGGQMQLLALHPELFHQRAEAGRIVEGHGDLRPEHICFTEPLEIFDCLEFSAELRQLDVADELAFLMAECDFLGAGWVGPRLWEEFHRTYGDATDPRLMAFYLTYRACVRAKVATLRADQLQGAERQVAWAEARAHLAWADRYVQPLLDPWLLVVGGLSGTGKSTLAAASAELLGAALLRTDVLRRELFSVVGGTVADQRFSPPPDQGLYAPQTRQEVYQAMFRRAAAWRAQGLSVVLDGTFSTPEAVAGLLRLAGNPPRRFLAIECLCPPEVARQRIAQRQAAGQDASQASVELHDLQRTRWLPWPAELPQLRLDTCLPLADQLEAVRRCLAELPAA